MPGNAGEAEWMRGILSWLTKLLAAGSGHCKGISTSSAVKESDFKALRVSSLLNQQFLHAGQTRGLVLKSIPLPLSHHSGRALGQCQGQGAPGKSFLCSPCQCSVLLLSSPFLRQSRGHWDPLILSLSALLDPPGNTKALT